MDCPNPEAYGEAHIAVPFVFQKTGREVRRFARNESGEIQVFIDDDPDQGKRAYEAFCPLAEMAVETLAANGLLERTEPPPDPSDPQDVWAFESMRMYYTREWTLFLHRMAKGRPGGLPRIASTPYLEHFRLKEGGKAHALTPGVFGASALVLGQVINEGARDARGIPTQGDGTREGERVPSVSQLVEIDRSLWRS